MAEYKGKDKKVTLTNTDELTDEIKALEACINSLIEQAQSLKTSISKMKDRIQRIKLLQNDINRKNKRAKEQHELIVKWESLAKFLASDKVKNLLTESINPFNEYLHDVSTCIKGWALVDFDCNNGLSYDGRSYHLLSESEKWRVDTAVSYAIAKLTDNNIFVLDRFDVLDLPSRLPFMEWLHGIAELGSVDSVIVAGTFKEKFDVPNTFNFIWLENQNEGK